MAQDASKTIFRADLEGFIGHKSSVS